MASYKLRPKAIAGLRSIRRWIAKDNPGRALSFVTELSQHFEAIAKQNLRHRLVTELGPDIRIAVHGNYNIYYRFVEDNGRDVLIIRVLHSARSIGGPDLR